jgi:Ca2+-binding EF-hand superfamily protein
MTQTEIDVLMANIDANENGHVNYTEFINATIDKKKAITSDKLKAAFDYFDTD